MWLARQLPLDGRVSFGKEWCRRLQQDRGGEMTPDARLSAAERAALAHLEAAAAAEDPRLAARLRGAPAARLRWLAFGFLPLLVAHLSVPRAAWARSGWWGVPVLAGGFGLMIAGLTFGLALAVVGALVATAGLRMLAGVAESRGHRHSS
jgi:hypothetical protein